jgi:hypothetical protein
MQTRMATHSILAEIEKFCATHQLAESTFGRLAVGDWKFIKELRGEGRDRPRRLWPDTEQRVRDFMVTYKPEGTSEPPDQAAVA